MPALTINGKQVEVPAGTNLIQAARAAGAEVPHFCYHPGLSVSGNCRMCLVEIEGQPKLQIACNTPAADKQVVLTDSPKVQKARAGVMEFLLLNHPIDCPVCDCAGECSLQDYYMAHDLQDSRLGEGKNKKKKAVDIGPHVMLDTERCVLCSRCVRFTAEVSKTHELGIFGRGSREEVGLFDGRRLENAYSGNVVDLCPVGALTDKQFRFKSRPWFLEEAETLCPGCSRGCNIVLNTNPNPFNKVGEGRAYRIYPRANADVNQHWICDAGRYAYAAIDEGRLTRPRVRGLAATPDQAVTALAAALKDALAQHGPSKVAFLLSPQLTVEELWSWAWLAGRLGISQVEAGDAIKATGPADDYLVTADKNPNSAGAGLLGLGPRAGVHPASDVLSAASQFPSLLAVEQPLEALSTPLAGRLLAVVNSHESPVLGSAAVALPRAVYAEQDGVFVNVNRRVQRVRKALAPLGEAQPAWVWAFRLAAAMGLELPCAAEAGAVFQAASAHAKAFTGMDHPSLGPLGLPARD